LLELARSVVIVREGRRIDVHDHLMLAPARRGRAVGERRTCHQDQRIRVRGGEPLDLPGVVSLRVGTLRLTVPNMGYFS
jgi:hypothetical protein